MFFNPVMRLNGGNDQQVNITDDNVLFTISTDSVFLLFYCYLTVIAYIQLVAK